MSGEPPRGLDVYRARWGALTNGQRERLVLWLEFHGTQEEVGFLAGVSRRRINEIVRRCAKVFACKTPQGTSGDIICERLDSLFLENRVVALAERRLAFAKMIRTNAKQEESNV